MKICRRGLFQALLGAPIAAAAAPVAAKTIYQIDLGRRTAMEVTREMRDAEIQKNMALMMWRSGPTLAYTPFDFVRKYDRQRNIIHDLCTMAPGPIVAKDYRIPFTVSSAAKS